MSPHYSLTSAEGITDTLYAAFRFIIRSESPVTVAMSTKISREKISTLPRMKSEMRGCVTPSRSVATFCLQPSRRISLENSIMRCEHALMLAAYLQ